MTRHVSRRVLVRRLGLVAGLGAAASILAACDSGMSAPPPKPTEAPKPAAPAVAPTTAPAKPAEAAGAQSAGAKPPAEAPKPAAAPEPTKPAGAAPAAQPAPGKAGTGVVKWFHRANVLENKWETEYAIPEYKKRQPGATVDLTVVPSAEFNVKLFALQAAGDMPNIFGFNVYSTYWARGMIIPLDDFLQGEQNIAGQHFPGMFDMFKWWGKRWGMPMAPRFGTATFFNMDLFDKAGVPHPKMDWTLKEWNADIMADYATKLTKNYGKPDVTFGVDYTPWEPHGLAYMWGGDVFTKAHYEQGIDQATTVDSEASREAHQFKYDLIHKHNVNPKAADQQTIQAVGNPFMTGRIAMRVEGGWAWSTFSPIKDFKWGATHVPGKKSVRNSENLNVWVLGNAPNREGAWDFVKFITSKDGQTAWVQITGAQPSRPDVLDEWVKKHVEHGMKAEDIRNYVTNNIKDTIGSTDHLIVDHSRFNDAYNQKVAALWDGKTTVAAFMADIKTTWDGLAKETYTNYKDKLLK